ncbi:hypothetical protein [Romboutsia ilealis]|uniref:hypothetical protein n=1 Tax=Romboutsia ilealis TaxID=1115758 RepID=UPI00289FE4F0|nr:hypothetical protein [Romboutsia ilealis]
MAVFFQVFITSIISVYIFPIAEYLNETYKIPENPTKVILFFLSVLALYIIQIYLNDKSEYGKYSKFVEDTNKNYEKFEGIHGKFEVYHTKIETYIDKHMSGIRKIEKLVKLNQKKTLSSISRHIEEMQDELIDRIQSIDTKYSNKVNENMQSEFRDDLNKLMKYSKLKLHTLTSEVYDSSDELGDESEVV